jgi:hypothetical protein
VSDITDVTALMLNNISNDGGAAVTARGVCWSPDDSNPTISLSTKTVDGGGIGSYSSILTGLKHYTSYYARAYATNSVGTSYGNIWIIGTIYTYATILLIDIGTSDYTSAFCNSNITDDGGKAVTSRGVCWSININPTINLSTKTVDGSGIGSFGSTLTGLQPFVTYYIRSYATNAAGTVYSNQLTFDLMPYGATISTNSVSNITSSTAICGGNVSSDGNSRVTARGVCWSTSNNPTVSLSTKTIDGNGIGLFVSNLTGLKTKTTYYVRAYATNSAGTEYGLSKTIITL